MAKKIFVGNLSFDAREDDLQTEFQSFGPIEDVVIVNDRETGRSRGFGFITFSSPDDAQKAIREMNGADFMKRQIKVNEAQDKSDRRFDGGGGGYRGGYNNRSGGNYGRNEGYDRRGGGGGGYRNDGNDRRGGGGYRNDDGY